VVRRDPLAWLPWWSSFWQWWAPESERAGPGSDSMITRRLIDGIYEAFSSRSPPLATEILRSDINYGGEGLCRLLADRGPGELTVRELREEVAGDLPLLSADVFF
jgi:hypothetical protein